jgi:hypothetical protein
MMAGALEARTTGATPGQTPAEAWRVPDLDAGFHLLYELKPEEARRRFDAWKKSHPEDPLGSASEAASYLFEECYRQGVLTSEFFLDNKRFLGKIPLQPDPKLRAAFFAAVKQAQKLAQLRLKTTPNDANALFAMALSLGLQADYASLIEKHQLDSLRMLREADKYAKRLLVISPGAADAYLGLGTANYVIGSLPTLKKFFLGLAGIHGDKSAGIRQLEIAAERGHYLRPFAKILLAMAALREKLPEVARRQLKELVAEFPENQLFVSELAKLNAFPAATLAPEWRIKGTPEDSGGAGSRGRTLLRRVTANFAGIILRFARVIRGLRRLGAGPNGSSVTGDGCGTGNLQRRTADPGTRLSTSPFTRNYPPNRLKTKPRHILAKDNVSLEGL